MWGKGNRSNKRCEHCVKNWRSPEQLIRPLPILLYINDLGNVVKDGQIAMFADDTTIVELERNTDWKIDEDRHRNTHWFTSSKLTVSIDKCEPISFGCGLPKKITCPSDELSYKSVSNYLGLYLDGCFSSREHKNYVMKELKNFVANIPYQTRLFKEMSSHVL